MLIFLTILVLSFGLVVFIGAPYLPTLKVQQERALDLLDLKPGQTVIDLGSGDGRFLLAAAKRDLNAVGIEANPLLVVVSYLLTFKYRNKVKIKWGNIWGSWPQADGIYVFLHTRFMSKLHKKITQQYTGKKVKVVSYAFEITDMKPVKSKNGLFLYKY